ncbi:MAG: hypothetical protein NT027_01855, partial [Proteobacteria bacterium]|nr:hypothetical protein [Pseudomonadota bacterium]
GQKITLTSNKGKLSISHIEKTNVKQENLTADWKQGDLVGKTLAQAIMSSWKILMNTKKHIDLSIFIPSKADRFRFEASSNGAIKNEIVTINVTAASWLVRQFVLPMTFNFKVVNQVPEIFSFGGPSPVDSGPYQGKPMLTKFKILKNPGDIPVLK